VVMSDLTLEMRPCNMMTGNYMNILSILDCCYIYLAYILPDKYLLKIMCILLMMICCVTHCTVSVILLAFE
jgi:hypothetical protein